MSYETKSPEGQNKGLKIGLIILGILLAIAIAGNVIYMTKSGRLSSEKEQLKTEVQALQNQISGLNETISVKDQIIAEHIAANELLREEHAAEIAEKNTRIANLGWRVNTRSKELEETREKNILLMAEKDEMEIQNNLLSEEINALRAQMDELAAAHQSLLLEVEKNKAINVYNMCIMTKWDRLICADRYNVTKARRVDHTFINFELDGSTFAETGNKNIHLQMLNPDGEVMYAASEMFMDQEAGKEIAYSLMQQVYYAGDPVQVVFDVIHPERLHAGIYFIRVYVDGKLTRVKEIALD